MEWQSYAGKRLKTFNSQETWGWGGGVLFLLKFHIYIWQSASLSFRDIFKSAYTIKKCNILSIAENVKKLQ